MIFSPFGLGVLDIALARYILGTLSDQDRIDVPGFFSGVGFDQQ